MDYKTELFMLDSGAFSVWNKGATIDLDTYIQFCKDHPQISYYVCLDVIQGGNVKPEQQDAACKQTWKNYTKMIKVLPEEKVIPVFHRGENWKWLERYLDYGSPYIGFGQTGGFGGKQSKKEYLKTLKTFLLGSDGKPIVKTHGFAVTSFDLMVAFPWHSVDSASWIKQGSFGGVWIPNPKGDGFVYNSTPWVVNFSPKSPSQDDLHKHYFNCKGYVKAAIDKYLEMLGVTLGDYEVVEVEMGYKLKKGELWYNNPKKLKQKVTASFAPAEIDDTKPSVMRFDDRGLVNCHNTRFWANMKFMQEMENFVPTENIYFAGGEGSLEDRVELGTKKRLMSYHALSSGSRPYKAMQKHLEIIG